MKHFNNRITKIKSWNPIMRKHASREIISDSVELCETDVCFLHIQLFGTNVWLPDWSFAEIRWYSTIAPNGMSGVKGHSEPPLIWCLPIRQEILNVSRIAITFHGIRPPFFVQTWLRQYCRCPFFHSAHCFSAIHVFLICVALTYNDSRIILHKTYQILRNCQCKWLLVSLSAPGIS